MHVIAPDRYKPRPVRRNKRSYLLLILVVLLTVAAINYVRPLPAATAKLHVTVPTTTAAPLLHWPSTGQAAIAANGYGLLATNGNQTPLATASIAKVILALCVLQKNPLTPGQSGPIYTISAQDVAVYNNYVQEDGSVMRVVAGEQLTEYQALVALMLPSANNIADSLATWVFGGHAAYASYATTFMQQQGLTQTQIGADASGFDPGTLSTASDLTQLGLLALDSPVLQEIAAQKSAVLPVVGTVYNYDTILGIHGITGLKTGNNEADPGAFLFTATSLIGGKPIALTGAVMGSTDLNAALQATTQLVASEQAGFEDVSVAGAGQTVGSLETPWGSTSPIIATHSLDIVRWRATPLTERHQLHTEVRSGTIGSMQISAGQAKTVSSLQLAHHVAGPSFWWRLTRH